MWLQPTRNVDWSSFRQAVRRSRCNRGWLQPPTAQPLPVPDHGQVARWRRHLADLGASHRVCPTRNSRAVQELSAPTIADSLIAARRRGVTIQVILENNYSTPWTEQTPSQLKPHQRQRWYQLEQLADQNGDGTTTR